jgi:hypothetical protein
MKHIKLSDTFRVSDSKIRGYVILRREDGSIVFKKENMIVEKGRKYIRDLVFSKISGETVSKYISKLKFGVGSFDDGTSAALTTPDMINLQNNISDYDKELITGTKWIDLTNSKIYTYVNVIATAVGLMINRATAIPSPVLGNTYFATDQSKLYTYTDNSWDNGVVVTNNEWDDGVTVTAAGPRNNRDTLIQDPVLGNTYFATDELKLYTYTEDWDDGVEIRTTLNHINLLSDPELGLRIDCQINGNSSSPEMINELGLFLVDIDNDDNNDNDEMFSRLIFEPVPFVNTMIYTLTYYIYF